MPNKKTDTSGSEDQTLERRVKAIMEPGVATPEPTTVAPITSQPMTDSSNGPQTAPVIPDKLLEKIGVKGSPKTAAEPSAPPESTAASIPSESGLVGPEESSTPLDNSDTDKAVDDIVVNESDAVLAAEDAAKQQATSKPRGPSGKSNVFKRLLRNRWFWLALIVLLAAVLAWPTSRYKLLGLIIKESVSVSVTDSKTNTPVSNATLNLDGVAARTDAAGRAALHVPPGTATLQITKQYYKPYNSSQAVGLRSGKHIAVQLIATGRQVPITVLNRITGKPLANAEISILDTTAKTNTKGQATIVLPTTAVSDSATVSLSGYNAAHASIAVTSSVVSSNTVRLVPAGQVYFLSNLSGSIDVVKANLDGSGRQTVLKGTGKEDPNTTSLLASRDWRYLVLKAQRDSAGPALYLIDTSDDKVTQFDGNGADFTLVGWYGHYFMYDVVRNSVSSWLSGREALKSYNADTGQLDLLDQNQAQGDSTSYAYQGFYNFYTINNLVAYNTQWYSYNASGGGYDLSSKTDTIRAVQPDGQGKKDYQSIPASNTGYIQSVLFEPQGVYYSAYSYATNANAYYKFENGSVSTLTNLTQNTFNQAYPTYLVSPSGNQTFWTELRDGQNALFVGDEDAQNQKQVASLDGYTPYGWFSDNYLLVSKNSSELYIMPSGPAAGQEPLKITDYYKPSQTYNNYGYGYGGL